MCIFCTCICVHLYKIVSSRSCLQLQFNTTGFILVFFSFRIYNFFAQQWETCYITNMLSDWSSSLCCPLHPQMPSLSFLGFTILCQATLFPSHSSIEWFLHPVQSDTPTTQCSPPQECPCSSAWALTPHWDQLHFEIWHTFSNCLWEWLHQLTVSSTIHLFPHKVALHFILNILNIKGCL